MDPSLVTDSSGSARAGRTRICLALLAAVVAAALAAPSALAERSPKPDPSLGVGVAGSGVTATVSQQQPLAETAVGGCRSVYAWRNYKTWYGYELWRYNLQVDWCYTGSTVYKLNRSRWVNCCGPGWSFDGHVGTSFQSGGSYSARSFTQGKFSFFLGTNNQYPWISITVYANGGYSWATG